MNAKRLAIPLSLTLALTALITCLFILSTPTQQAQADANTLYVAADGNCNGATPCYTTLQAAVDAAATNDTIKVAQGVYTSTGFQVVYINKAITLTGGYATGDWGQSRPVTYPTVIDAEDISGHRGLYINGSQAATITLSGVTIKRGRLNNSNGAGIYILNGKVIIRESQVLSNTTHGNETAGGGVFIANSTVILQNNQFISNTVDGDSTHGGGLYVGSGAIALYNNRFQENNVLKGSGGGFYLYEGVIDLEHNIFDNNFASRCGGADINGIDTEAELIANRFQYNSGGAFADNCNTMVISGNFFLSNTTSIGGGIQIHQIKNITMTNNLFQGNHASSLHGGAYLNDSKMLTLSNNVFRNNTAPDCGGIGTSGDRDFAGELNVFENNIFENNSAEQNGGGLCLMGEEDFILKNNSILSNVAGGSGGGIYISNHNKAFINSNGNLILSNTAALHGAAIAAENVSTNNPDIRTQNEIIANNVSPWEGVYLPRGIFSATHWTLVGNGGYALNTGSGDNQGALLFNSIVASHTTAGLWGLNLQADHTLFFNNGIPCGNGASCNNSLNLDPQFLDPEADDYHLRPTSPAIDAGLDSGVTADFEGDPRPIHSGYDIGADELISIFPPTASFTSSTPDWIGQQTLFHNTSSESYALYLWNFGDRTTSTLFSPTHLYQKPGSYTVILTATTAGGTAVATNTVIVNAASFTTSSPCQIGKAVLFTNTTTANSLPDYLWSFGDGITSTAESPSHTYAEEGLYTVVMTATDSEGSGIAAATISVTSFILTGTIGINNNIDFVSTPVVSLTLSAYSRNSSVDKMQLRNDDASWGTWESFASYKSWTLSTGQGTKTVYVRYQDHAGNLSEVYSDTVILDSVAPTGTLAINDGASYAMIPTTTLTLYAVDQTSGIDRIRLSNTGSNWTAWEPYTTTGSCSLPSGDGSKTVYDTN